jgi:hypothetical protein
MSKDTVYLAGIWEQANKQDLNPVEFDGVKDEAGGKDSFP